MKFSTRRKYYNFRQFRREFGRYGLRSVKSYEIILFWLKARLNRSQFLMLAGILVGCTAGLAGVLLKSLVHYIHHLITQIHFEYQLLFYAVFPFIGIVLTAVVVVFAFKGQDRKGIGAILYEIARNSSIVSHVKMYSQIVQSAITMGFGGSAGLESPIAVTGAAIGSNFAQTYHLPYKERTLLLAAGATAGIASAFNAPIAGIMFAFEILLTGVVFTDFIPLVVAAVCGSLISHVVLQEDVLFRFHARESFNYLNVPYYLVLGLLSGLYARYFLVVSLAVERFFGKLPYSRIEKGMLGGALLSTLCILFPPLFGEGYETIKMLINGNTDDVLYNSIFRYASVNGWTLIVFLAFVMILKAFATSVTIQSGGNGGNFAPTLFAGGLLGYLFGISCEQVGLPHVPVSNLALAGMAGVMSGALYAPLTAIFLIAESSLGYDLFIPLMMVSVISYLLAKWFSPLPPDFKHMAEAGKIFTREYDKNLLSTLRTEDFVDRNACLVPVDAEPEQLMEAFGKSNKNIAAVVDGERRLAGVVTLDDMRPYLFNPELRHTLAPGRLMKAPPEIIYAGEDVQSMVRKFDETDSWNLPVVDEERRFAGFVSKSAILTRYRQLLQEYSG